LENEYKSSLSIKQQFLQQRSGIRMIFVKSYEFPMGNP
jgi:hypothetical protein